MVIIQTMAISTWHYAVNYKDVTFSYCHRNQPAHSDDNWSHSWGMNVWYWDYWDIEILRYRNIEILMSTIWHSSECCLSVACPPPKTQLSVWHCGTSCASLAPSLLPPLLITGATSWNIRADCGSVIRPGNSSLSWPGHRTKWYNACGGCGSTSLPD